MEPSSNVQKIVIIVLGVALLGALIWAVTGQYRLAQLHDESTKAIEAHLRTIKLQSQQVAALDSLAQRVEKFNRDFGAAVGRVQIGESLENNLKSLERRDIPAEAKKALDEFERNIADIQAMMAKVQEYERYLGSPIIVKRGDSHAQIAKAYLMNEAGLPAKDAEEAMKQTALAWELEPGNKVFNLYKDGLLLSTVTQGTAKRAPLMAQFAQRQAAAEKIRVLEEKTRALEAKCGAAAAAP